MRRLIKKSVWNYVWKAKIYCINRQQRSTEDIRGSCTQYFIFVLFYCHDWQGFQRLFKWSLTKKFNMNNMNSMKGRVKLVWKN